MAPFRKKKNIGVLNLLGGIRTSSLRDTLRSNLNETTSLQNHLVLKNIALPSCDVSLRSLRSSRAQGNITSLPIRRPETLNATPAGYPSDQVSLRSSRPLGNVTSQPISHPESVNASHAGYPSDQMSRTAMNGPSVENRSVSTEAAPENKKNDSVFLVPKARAPKAAVRDPAYWIEHLREKALLSWCTLDKTTAEKSFCLIIIYILSVIEECSDLETSNSETRSKCNSERAQLVFEWLQKYAEPGTFPTKNQVPGSGFSDVDCLSSVSGYTNSRPFVASNPYERNHMSDFYRSAAPGYENNYYRGMDHGGAASVVGSMFEDENQFRYQPSVTSSMMTSDVRKALPTFIARSNHQLSNSSMVGSSFQAPYGNQFSFLQNSNPPTMGYPSRAMSVRSDASFAPRMSVLADNYSNCSMMRNPNNYSQMHQMSFMNGNPLPSNEFNFKVPGVNRRANANGMENVNLLGDSNFRVPGVNRRAYASGGENVNLLGRTTCENGPPRNPLQPSVILQKANLADAFATERTRNHERNLTMGNLNRSSNVPNLRDPRLSFNRHNNLHNLTLLRNMTSNVCGQTIPENEDSLDEVQNRTVIRTGNIENLPPVLEHEISGRLLRSKSNTPKSSALNESGVIRITRSGRQVRAPQNFWSSDSFISVTNRSSQSDRTRKRKRP